MNTVNPNTSFWAKSMLTDLLQDAINFIEKSYFISKVFFIPSLIHSMFIPCKNILCI